MHTGSEGAHRIHSASTLAAPLDVLRFSTSITNEANFARDSSDPISARSRAVRMVIYRLRKHPQWIQHSVHWRPVLFDLGITGAIPLLLTCIKWQRKGV